MAAHIENQVTLWLRTLPEVLAAEKSAVSDGGALDDEVDETRIERIRNCLSVLESVWPVTEGLQEESRSDPDEVRVGDTNAVLENLRFGRFRVLEELGRGGHGVVFRAVDPNLHREVALKLPRRETLASPQLRQRFLREAQALSKLNHPNLLRVHEAAAVGPAVYIVSEFCPGPSLSAWIKQANSPLDPRIAAQIVSQLADTVDYIHTQGILHRDLKPANVLLESRAADQTSQHLTHDEQGLPFSLKLTDFGIARFMAGDKSDTETGVVLGTPAYMAPEQSSGHTQRVGIPTDVYGLGAILHELLTGQPPFVHRQDSGDELPPSDSNPCCPNSVPAQLWSICWKCLEFDPQQRYQSAHQLATDLQEFVGASRSGHAAGSGQWKTAWRLAAVSSLFFLPLALVVSRRTDMTDPSEGATKIAVHFSPHSEGSQNGPRLISLLEEDWEDQQVGDRSDRLVGWRGPAGRGLDAASVHTIVSMGHSKVLSFDTRESVTGKTYLGSVPERPFLPAYAGQMLSASFDARLQLAPRGQLTFAVSQVSGESRYNLVINDHRTEIELLRFASGDSEGSSLGVCELHQTELKEQFHRYELRLLFETKSIQFQVLCDNRLRFTATDTTPVLNAAVPVRFQFQVYPRSGKVAWIDNIRVLAGAGDDFPLGDVERILAD